MRGGRLLLLWPGVVASAVVLGRGSYVALVTPMDAANAVDYGALRKLLEWHVASGTDGVVALGTTGEASTLDAAERDKVLETCVDACRGRVPVVAGTGAIDTRAVVAMGRRAKALGADGTLVVTPYYVKPPQRALEAHFLQVAEAVDLPMVLYNVPGRTGVDLLPETVERLAKVPNIVGIKEATHVVQDLLRLHRERGIVLVEGQILDDGLAQGLTLRNVEQRQISTAAFVDALVDLPQGIGHISHHLDIDVIVRVDLRRLEVNVDDRLAAPLVPVGRCVFDQVVAHRDHHIGPLHPFLHRVLRPLLPLGTAPSCRCWERPDPG